MLLCAVLLFYGQHHYHYTGPSQDLLLDSTVELNVLVQSESTEQIFDHADDYGGIFISGDFQDIEVPSLGKDGNSIGSTDVEVAGVSVGKVKGKGKLILLLRHWLKDSLVNVAVSYRFRVSPLSELLVCHTTPL